MQKANYAKLYGAAASKPRRKSKALLFLLRWCLKSQQKDFPNQSSMLCNSQSATWEIFMKNLRNLWECRLKMTSQLKALNLLCKFPSVCKFNNCYVFRCFSELFKWINITDRQTLRKASWIIIRSYVLTYLYTKPAQHKWLSPFMINGSLLLLHARDQDRKSIKIMQMGTRE